MAKKHDFFKNKKGDESQFLIVLAVIIVIALIIVYCLSFGGINFLKRQDEKRIRLRWIDERLKDLHVEAQTKEGLKKELDARVKKWFLIARSILACLFLGANVAGYFWCTDRSLSFSERVSCLLNYNELGLIGILIVLFIVFESPAEFKDVFKLLHLYIRRIVYKGHHELDADLIRISAEIDVLYLEKDSLSKELNDEVQGLDE